VRRQGRRGRLWEGDRVSAQTERDWCQGKLQTGSSLEQLPAPKTQLEILGPARHGSGAGAELRRTTAPLPGACVGPLADWKRLVDVVPVQQLSPVRFALILNTTYCIDYESKMMRKALSIFLNWR
jgi:hypothetical protein